MERLIVVGGDAAGMSAASQARRLRAPDDLEIAAFERGNFTSYSACGIPYFLGSVVDDLDQLVARTPETFRAKQAIDAHVRHEVTDIDLDKGAVRARDADGVESWERYDELVYATGAIPIRPPLPGVDREGIFGVQTLDDGLAIRRFMGERRPARAVVVGGGYIGLEMAEAFKTHDLQVTVVEARRQPMSSLDPDMGELVADAMRGIGIVVRTEESVTGFESSGGRVCAVVTEHGTLPAEVVV